MSITIFSNIASVRAQRRLSQHTAALQASFQRLSSGLRVSKASDDAAGFAIARGLNTDGRVFDQGSRNVADGLSLLTVADGALAELSNIAVRLTELASEAQNGTVSLSQRRALDAEAQALSREYSRIIQTTDFNDTKLLNGTNPGNSIQAGYGADGRLSAVLGGAIGDGTFSTFASYTTAASPTGVSLQDLNGDGALDISFMSRTTGYLQVYIGNGDATFKAPASYAASTQGFVPVASDFNGDGFIDLVSPSPVDNTISVLLGNGDGSFKAQVTSLIGASPHVPGTADFNGDGLMDLAEGGAATPVYVMLSNGNGTFRVSQTYSGGTNPWGFATLDVNGDGANDISTLSLTENAVYVALGNGDGSFRGAQSFAAGIGAGVNGADFNGDGFMDLITADENVDTMSVLLGNGDGSFKARIVVSVGDGPKNASIGDFNGDGIVDFATAYVNAATTDVWLGNGNGTFRLSQSISTGATTTGSAVGDMNGDGVLDVVANSQSTNTLQIILGDTNSGTAPLQSFSLKNRFEAIQASTQFAIATQVLVKQRGTIGALESRYGTALNVLQQSGMMYKESESRIMDVDVADETAQLLRNKILQQATVAVLAQANSLPRIALQLLS